MVSLAGRKLGSSKRPSQGLVCQMLIPLGQKPSCGGQQVTQHGPSGQEPKVVALILVVVSLANQFSHCVVGILFIILTHRVK